MTTGFATRAVAALLCLAAYDANAQISTPGPAPNRPGSITPAPSDATLSEILAELKALRTQVEELRAFRTDFTAASQQMMQVQLLVGRVQMQEMRIAYLDGQRAQLALKVNDAGAATRAAAGARGPTREVCARASAADRRDCEVVVAERAKALGNLQATEQQLRTQEADARAAVEAEQNRWADFNARLDVFERAVAPR